MISITLVTCDLWYLLYTLESEQFPCESCSVLSIIICNKQIFLVFIICDYDLFEFEILRASTLRAALRSKITAYQRQQNLQQGQSNGFVADSDFSLRTERDQSSREISKTICSAFVGDKVKQRLL